MSFEQYTKYYDGWDENKPIKPGQSEEFTLDPVQVNEKKAHRLFVTGETSLFYLWKNEPKYPLEYREITDALDTEHSVNTQYCLDLSMDKKAEYVRRVHKKVQWNPVLAYLPMVHTPDDWQYGVSVIAENLDIADNGYLRIVLEIRFEGSGRGKDDFSNEPDETYVLDIDGGSYGQRVFKQGIVIPAHKTSTVAYRVEGLRYSGKVYLEAPFLTASNGYNVLPDFSVPVFGENDFNWIGQNISRKEWVSLSVTLNGTEIFNGEVFERCHRGSEWEIDIPDNIIRKGENTLSITNRNAYHDPMPYIIREIGIIEQPKDALTLLACPRCATAGEYAPILIKTERNNITVHFASADGKLQGEKEYTFKKKGLHGIRLACPRPAVDACFSLTAEGITVSDTVPQIAEKQDDGIITGTGDLIYIYQGEKEFEEYLSWYISNDIGRMLTIRPTYRWSGTRVINEELWKDTARVLNELGMKYVHMLDGRELPGLDCNPSRELIEGEGFLGRQLHEGDGALFYWGAPSIMKPADKIYADLSQLIYREHPQYTSPASSWAYIFDGNESFVYRDTRIKNDHRASHDHAMSRLSGLPLIAERHTGPSVMFKYFYEAGYKWVGAETMYTTMEITLSFLRGANLQNAQKALGVHHAVQWSTSPQDTPDRFRRYRLALYVSYMLGATDINTEEGLWHLEEYYAHCHRFSVGCRGHIKTQQDFNHYILSHTRRGSFYTAAGFIHGRLDGWNGFVQGRVWSFDNVNICDPEYSWNIMKIPYPLGDPGGTLYFHGIAPDKPAGYHSGTPFGQVDTLPIECDGDIFKKYKFLAFGGYNCATKKDLDKLENYVLGGGTLIMTRAHLATATSREKIESYDLDPIEHTLSFTKGKAVYEISTVGGREVQICTNALDGEVMEKTDNGKPLLIKYPLGKGVVIMLNANAYPAHGAISDIYGDVIRNEFERVCAKEHSFIECGNDIEFSVYERDDGKRDFYILPVDWYNTSDSERHATLRIGQNKYDIAIPFGVMVKATVFENTAAWCCSEDGEVLDSDGYTARLQGIGTVDFVLAKNGNIKRITLDFAESPIQTAEFE